MAYYIRVQQFDNFMEATRLSITFDMGGKAVLEDL
jgi:hypothetical protein